MWKFFLLLFCCLWSAITLDFAISIRQFFNSNSSQKFHSTFFKIKFTAETVLKEIRNAIEVNIFSIQKRYVEKTLKDFNHCISDKPTCLNVKFEKTFITFLCSSNSPCGISQGRFFSTRNQRKSFISLTDYLPSALLTLRKCKVLITRWYFLLDHLHKKWKLCKPNQKEKKLIPFK